MAVLLPAAGGSQRHDDDDDNNCDENKRSECNWPENHDVSRISGIGQSQDNR